MSYFKSSFTGFWVSSRKRAEMKQKGGFNGKGIRVYFWFTALGHQRTAWLKLLERSRGSGFAFVVFNISENQ